MELRKLNKKGAEMTIGTLVIIVLAVIVLVILVLGFTTGWNNLWDNISNFFSGGGDVKTIVNQCTVAATVSNTFDYCCKAREVKFSEKEEIITCADTRISGMLGEGITPLTCPEDYCEPFFKGECESIVEGCPDPGNDDQMKKFCCHKVQALTCADVLEVVDDLCSNLDVSDCDNFDTPEECK